jgi:sortase (surface protein transpeptidase)
MSDYKLENWYKTSGRSYRDSIQADVALSRLLQKTAKILLIVGIILGIAGLAPGVLYSVNPDATRKISELIKSTAKEQVETVPVSEEPSYQPAFNPNLTQENRLTIGSVKIDTGINEADWENYEEALKIGVWRVPDFGTPYGRSKPTILAAHRFGYLKWSVPYRLKNSFYNLPKTKVGDTIEIIWKQRKYVYEIYKEEEGEEITDYTAELILYTCESLNSPIRIFRYARLLEI